MSYGLIHSAFADSPAQPSAVLETKNLGTRNAGNGTSGGGGGKRVAGKLMTFFSAGFYTEPTPAQDAVEIPGLNELVQYWKAFPYLSGKNRMQLIDVVLPTDQHQYYRVQKDYFDAPTRAALIDAFARVTGANPNEIELFAVTDTQARITYLLPEFYELNTQGQMAILLHESYWLLRPTASYNDVLGVEMSFQAVMEQPENMNRVYQLLQLLTLGVKEVRNDSFRALVGADLSNDALAGLVFAQGIPFDRLVGKDYAECVRANAPSDCKPLLLYQLLQLKNSYPRSLLLRRIYESAAVVSPKFFTEDLRLSDDPRSWTTTRQSLWTDLGIPIHGVFYVDRTFWTREKAEYEDLDLSRCFVKLETQVKAFRPEPSNLPVECNGPSGRPYRFTTNWIQ